MASWQWRQSKLSQKTFAGPSDWSLIPAGMTERSLFLSCSTKKRARHSTKKKQHCLSHLRRTSTQTPHLHVRCKCDSKTHTRGGPNDALVVAVRSGIQSTDRNNTTTLLRLTWAHPPVRQHEIAGGASRRKREKNSLSPSCPHATNQQIEKKTLPIGAPAAKSRSHLREVISMISPPKTSFADLHGRSRRREWRTQQCM